LDSAVSCKSNWKSRWVDTVALAGSELFLAVEVVILVEATHVTADRLVPCGNVAGREQMPVMKIASISTAGAVDFVQIRSGRLGRQQRAPEW
jgi:hypothetical protein